MGMIDSIYIFRIDRKIDKQKEREINRKKDRQKEREKINYREWVLKL